MKTGRSYTNISIQFERLSCMKTFMKTAIILSFLLITIAFAANITEDVNNDGVVNILDLTLIASRFGENIDPSEEPNPDANGDGIVDIRDLVLVANKLGQSISENTLIFGRGGDSITLDPANIEDGESAKVCDMIYDTLVQYRENTTDLEPALAISWTRSADALTWTFNLREGVLFHDGTPFNADAVVFSLTRPLVLFRNFHEQFISQIIALDPLTVQIQLKTPYAPFISTLAGTSFSIVSPTAVHSLGEKPVGTGPFKFSRWDKDDKIVLNANNTYWAGPPALDCILFRSIPDNATRLAELQAGNLHAMEFPNPDDIPLIQGEPQLDLLMQPSLNLGYLALNMEKPPFDNLKVRLAINHAINKVDIVDRLYQGLGIPAKNPIPPTLWSYDDSIEDYEHNPELAKQLLSEAGYPDGFETTLWSLPVPRPYIPDGMALADAIQSDLQVVGINANIVTFDWATYLNKTAYGEHDMAMLGWIADVADPDNFFYSLLSIPNAEKPAYNISFYRNETLQQLLDRARMSTDEDIQDIESQDLGRGSVITDRDVRTRLYQQAQAIVHKDAPWVPIAHAQRILVISKDVKNLKLSPLGWKYLRTASFE
ncbi:ABC transporter substrate-binding protein [Candidatus Poribacteria bacterium]|nr:MAG: ABC transporter substrate-binding protein [Candidatus Poribacteria bacterium]